MDNIEEKQNFLRAQILEKGYDPKDFVGFLTHKRGEEGADINQWTFLDLKIVVREFKIMYKPCILPKIDETIKENREDDANVNANSSSSHEKDTNASSNTTNMVVDTPPNENTNSAPLQSNNSNTVQIKETNASIEDPIKESDIKEVISDLPKELPKEDQKEEEESKAKVIEETLQCKIIETTDFSFKERIIVQISDPEKVEGGLFSKSYVSYTIRTLPFEFITKKRYSDFEWLKEKLQSIYIGTIIPSIPKKNFGDRFNETFIYKRMRTLEKFFETILSNPLLKSSQIIYDFLAIENDATFQEKKLAYNNMKPPSRLAEIKSLTASLNLGITNGKEIYQKNIRDNANNNFALLQKLSQSYKTLTNEIDIVRSRMVEISNIWKQLYDNSTKYFDNAKVCDSYKLMSTVMDKWAEAQKQQADIISIDIREHFKYYKNEYRTMKEFITRVDLNKSSYYKAEERLLWQKAELFKKQDILKWELEPNDLDNKKELIMNRDLAMEKMLPKETESVRNMKKGYGFLLNACIEEYERLKILNGHRHKDTIRTFYRLHHNVITEYLKVLSKIMNGYINSNESKEEIDILAPIEDYVVVFK